MYSALSETELLAAGSEKHYETADPMVSGPNHVVANILVDSDHAVAGIPVDSGHVVGSPDVPDTVVATDNGDDCCYQTEQEKASSSYLPYLCASSQ